MLFYLFVVGFYFTAVNGQDCAWVNSLDCSSYSTKPLCGSNFVTYRNRCEFAQLHCVNPNVNILEERTCAAAGFTSAPTTMKPTTPKPTTQPPVVTTKPTTAKPSTAQPTTTMPASTMPPTTHKPVFLGHDLIFDFFCLELSHEQCPNDTEPVCGSDGKLYPNFCEFEKHRCSHRELKVDHFQSC